jgi:hypothetical protein
MIKIGNPAAFCQDQFYYQPNSRCRNILKIENVSGFSGALSVQFSEMPVFFLKVPEYTGIYTHRI